jgi:hypothetical protein
MWDMAIGYGGGTHRLKASFACGFAIGIWMLNGVKLLSRKEFTEVGSSGGSCYVFGKSV